MSADHDLGHEYINLKTQFSVLWGMVIDIDKCTGCGACMVACQAENNLPIQEDASNKLRSMNWLMVYELSNKKPFPEHDVAYLPRPCMQCLKPSCVTVCPVTATDKTENGGIVSQVTPRCIGCRYCMASCPYHARYFNWFDPKWPEGMEKTLTPDVSVRPRGVVEKCTFCHHRLMAAKDKLRKEVLDIPADETDDELIALKERFLGSEPIEKLFKDGDYVTTCTEACPNGAITFGDLLNEEHAVSYLCRSKYVFRILERLGTRPQVYYMSRREWVRKLGDNYLDGEELMAPYEPLVNGKKG